jgi:hypothetical protein
VNGVSADMNLRNAALQRSISRRRFLWDVARTTAGASVCSFKALGQTLRAPSPAKKLIVVTFGGGARDEETFAPEGQRFIPRMLGELIPCATFFTQVVNRGILGHYVANATLATGCYESFDNFAPTSPRNPTLFEYYRRDSAHRAEDVWVIAPSNGFDRIGASNHPGYGTSFGATMVLPKQLLGRFATGSSESFDHLLRDSYEDTSRVSASDNHATSLQLLADQLKLPVSQFLAYASSISSPDELSLYIAQHLMQHLAPNLLWITLHDIDVAHAGAYSLYTDAILRTDRICAELWKSIQLNPEYKNKTNMFVMPDFGRDGDFEPGGNGFQHHRTGDPLSRTTWMLALGPEIHENISVDRMVESIDLVPTLAAILGCNASFAAGKPLAEVL